MVDLFADSLIEVGMDMTKDDDTWEGVWMEAEVANLVANAV